MNQENTLKKTPLIIWEARYKKHKAIIKSTQSAYPSWIHENATRVRWKVIQGEEFLNAK